jgi:PleD family two-component response regulator
MSCTKLGDGRFLTTGSLYKDEIDHPGAIVDQHTVLIISDNATDQLVLTSCLERAQPRRFRLATSESMERPLEALMDPAYDVVIIAHGAETEYLLRLAQKNNVTVPILVLLDEMQDEIVNQLREYGAQDYLVRGQLQDALVHRILDYSIQLKSAREEIRRLSNRDSLTGALNRTGFRANTALLYINIDQFANINDHYGEADGDLMIQTISNRLLNKLRSTDSIARLGGDEFAVVLEDVSSEVHFRPHGSE